MQRLLVLIALAFALVFAVEIMPNGLVTVNVARYRAVGTLNIQCIGVNKTSSPFGIESTLIDLASNDTVGNYNGTFYNDDGSFTRAVQTLNTTANPGNLANFLAVALRNSGDDDLDRIILITRYDTVGGAIDASDCTEEENGTISEVDFQASYGFYRAVAPPTQTTFAELEESARATGTLRYTCVNGAWTGPSGIDSILTEIDDDDVFGIYNGSFVATDGSRTSVIAGTATNINVAPGAALPYFLARAAPVNGTGDLDNISYIARYDTVGGVPLATDVCTLAVNGTVITRSFSASYNFYSATNGTTSSSTMSSSSTRSSATSTEGSDASMVALSFALLTFVFAIVL